MPGIRVVAHVHVDVRRERGRRQLSSKGGSRGRARGIMQIEAGAAAMQRMGHREHRCDSDPPRYKQAIWRLCQRKAIFWKADQTGTAELQSLVHPKRSPASGVFSKYRNQTANRDG